AVFSGLVFKDDDLGRSPELVPVDADGAQGVIAGDGVVAVVPLGRFDKGWGINAGRLFAPIGQDLTDVGQFGREDVPEPCLHLRAPAGIDLRGEVPLGPALVRMAVGERGVEVPAVEVLAAARW